MSAKSKKLGPVTAQHKEMLAKWLKGTGRSELTTAYALKITRGELRRVLCHAAGDVSWADLNEQRKGKKSKRAAAPKAPKKEDAPKAEGATEITVVKTIKKEARRKTA